MHVIDVLVKCSADFSKPKHNILSSIQNFTDYNKYFTHLAYTFFDYSVFIVQTAEHEF